MRLVDDDSPFRAKALEQYRRGRDDEGHLLEVDARWVRWADVLLVAFALAALGVAAWYLFLRGAHA